MDGKEASRERPAEVLIAGGGIAGMEALLALLDLGGSRLHVTMISDALAARELGADFRLGRLASVDTADQSVTLDDGSTLGYDDLVVCPGARRVAPYDGVPALTGPQL